MRQNLERKGIYPGPSAYSTQNAVAHPGDREKGPKIGTSLRNLEQSSLKTPGPGAYKLATSIGSGLKMIIHERPRPSIYQEATPGPAGYDNTLCLAWMNAPRAVFGTSDRMRSKSASDVGPGQHQHLLSNGDGPAWS
jgi:hypothetical protein